MVFLVEVICYITPFLLIHKIEVFSHYILDFALGLPYTSTVHTSIQGEYPEFTNPLIKIKKFSIIIHNMFL